MDKVEKWRKKAYLVLILIMAILAISSFFAVKTGVYDPTKEFGLQKITPVSFEEKEDGTSEYYFEFKRLTPSTRNMLFYTNHQEVRVYMNNVMVYANMKSDSIFGHTTGAVWNQIELPEIEGRVKVLITPVYSSIKPARCTFYQGNGVAMGYTLILKSLPAMLICLIIIVIGICMLCFWAFAGMNHKSSYDMFYLGLLVLFMGIWSLGETQGIIYLLRNRVAASYLAYTCLMAVGILFTMFTHRFMHLHDRLLFGTIMTYGFVEIVVCELLQFFHIYDMKQSFILTHILIASSVMYMLYGIVYNLRRHCYMRRTIVDIIGFIVLFITLNVDIYLYYGNRVNANQIGKFGVLIYVVMVGIETLSETKQQIREEEHLQMYREMALKDMLTGCYNRNAYDEQLEHEKDIKWSQVVTFDLNNLKHCNDTYGHQCGDKYLCDSAAIIRSVYGKHGKVYRIGGDEFCVITRGLSMKQLSDLQVRMEQAEREYNQRKTDDTKIEIACGYAMYDEKADKTIEDIRMRADVRMYEDKKELKAKSDRVRRVL